MTAPSVDREADPYTRDHMIALLSIYASQVGSYTTLLWQVPALSLTAQSFLLTIALSGVNGATARVTAAQYHLVKRVANFLPHFHRETCPGSVDK